MTIKKEHIDNLANISAKKYADKTISKRKVPILIEDKRIKTYEEIYQTGFDLYIKRHTKK